MLQARVIKRGKGARSLPPKTSAAPACFWRYVQKREDLTQLHCRLEERPRVYTSRVGYGFLLQLLHKPQKLENGAAPCVLSLEFQASETENVPLQVLRVVLEAMDGA